MEPAVLITLVIVALVILPFVLAVLVFRPLVNSVADRIAGRRGNAQEFKDLRQKVYLLEEEVSHLRGKLMALEDSQQFSQKMLEDLDKRSTGGG